MKQAPDLLRGDRLADDRLLQGAASEGKSRKRREKKPPLLAWLDEGKPEKDPSCSSPPGESSTSG
jgi:hypothetical protein